MPQARRTDREMFPLLERYLASHQTQQAFAAAHGLSKSTLAYWLRRYRQAARPGAAAGAFLELTPPPAEQPLLEVVYPQGVRLRLFALVEPAYLARLLVLAGPPA